jgi:hypothetical protein
VVALVRELPCFDQISEPGNLRAQSVDVRGLAIALVLNSLNQPAGKRRGDGPEKCDSTDHQKHADQSSRFGDRVSVAIADRVT